MKPPLAAVASALGLQVRRNRTSCPVHGGSNPQSLSFKGERATCFSCGWSGDAIELIRTLEGVSFPDALRRLQDLGFDTRPWDRPLPPRKPRRNRCRPVTVDPTTLWQEILRDTHMDEEELRLLVGEIADGVRGLYQQAKAIRQAATEDTWDLLRHAAKLERTAEEITMTLDELVADRQWRAWHADPEHAGATA